MGYRRLFIIRKDLQLSPGKLAAMVGHCAEAYWTRMLSMNAFKFKKWEFKEWGEQPADDDDEVIGYEPNCLIDKDIYMNNI